MSRLIILLFTFHSSLFTVQSQDVSFYKENITMQIEDGYFYVTGDYYLNAGNDSSIVLFYPFPVDSLYGEVDSLIIHNMTGNEPIETLSRKESGAAFKVDFKGKKEAHILINYRQKLPGKRAEYILKSTAGWRKPLEQADYQLIVPADLEIVSFSITPDEMIQVGDEKIYYWFEKDYMPRVNMIFEFE